MNSSHVLPVCSTKNWVSLIIPIEQPNTDYRGKLGFVVISKGAL